MGSGILSYFAACAGAKKGKFHKRKCNRNSY